MACSVNLQVLKCVPLTLIVWKGGEGWWVHMWQNKTMKMDQWWNYICNVCMCIRRSSRNPNISQQHRHNSQTYLPEQKLSDGLLASSRMHKYNWFQKLIWKPTVSLASLSSCQGLEKRSPSSSKNHHRPGFRAMHRRFLHRHVISWAAFQHNLAMTPWSEISVTKLVGP